MFNIKRIKPDLGFRIVHREVVFGELSHLIDQKYGYKLDLEVKLESLGCNLQRGDVWTTFQKQQLILSILKDVYIPPLAVLNYVVASDLSTTRERSIYKIIDGKQRLLSALQFLDNQFTISDGEGDYYFKELPKDVQLRLLRFDFRCSMAYSYPEDRISDKSLIKWFRLINFAGTAQEDDHLKFLSSILDHDNT